MVKDIQLEDIYKIIDRFETSGLGELEIGVGDVHVRMKKEIAGARIEGAPVVNISETPPTAPAPAAGGETITAPVVGTFYRAPSPDSEPFVSVGDKVREGDVVAIVEAMKVMNEVVAPCAGVIASIEVQDGGLVEYDQVLMRLEV